MRIASPDTFSAESQPMCPNDELNSTTKAVTDESSEQKIVMSTRNARKKLSPRSATQKGNSRGSMRFVFV
jgi:hypothetical protein